MFARMKSIQSACDWAREIAGDNSFCYGVGARAHHNGCYFCGTNITGPKKAKKGDKWEKTYCCNPFVGAAFAHGMGLNKGKCWNTGLSEDSWKKRGFKKISAKSVSVLMPGDVLLKPGKHIKLYLGNKEVAHAKREGWDNKSICVERIKSIGDGYIVMRYKTVKAEVKTTAVYPQLPKKGYFDIGDSGTSVAILQKWLNSHGFKCGNADGIYGAKTSKAVKKFQNKYKLTVDGKFGEKSLAKMKGVK